MTPSQPMRPRCGRTPSLILSGRAAALYSGFRCVRRCAQQSAHVVTRPPCCPLPPVPPASRNGRATTPPLRERGRAGRFFRRERAGSAENSGIPGLFARKSLIVEKTPAPCGFAFAPIRPDFAPSPIFAPVAGAPFSSLSNSLKKKKKEYEERQGIDSNAMPRVMPVLPSIADAAYFLCPESKLAPRFIRGKWGRAISNKFKQL
ncbi:putative baseplate J family protein [Burkholderia phage AP3]|uniref:Putative baseplate J family protein n=1 Tax=Burkholderia phage AP3 TaxID=1636201 RepID=A0A1S5NNJ0_9CAUD|nr:putative baseplate J family protein [Burkholderia phage AP3]AKA61171.1 putative baseplate J family protein [Burkholderia phage AP3]